MNKLNIPVEEFTTPDPVTATEDNSVEELADLMKKFGVRHLPIIRNQRVVGIVSDRDIRIVAGLNVHQKRLVQARDIMVENPVTVSADLSLDEVAFEMSRLKIGSVIVTEDGDKFLGIFTVTDALNALIEIARESQ